MKKFQPFSVCRNLYQQWGTDPKRATVSNVVRETVKVIAAILIWASLFVCFLWIKSLGYWVYFRLVVAVYLAASLISLIHPQIRRFIWSTLPAAIEKVFNVCDEKMNLIAFLYVALFSGGILYFILCAPYGVLCHVGLKPCGK